MTGKSSKQNSMRVLVSSHAQNELRKLSRQPKLYVKLRQALNNLGNNPLCGEALKGDMTGMYKLRVSSY